MALITAENFREYYGKLGGVALDDGLEAGVIAQADGLIAAYCGYPTPDDGIPTLGSTAYTLFFNAPARRQPDMLCLDVAPVVSVTSVHVDADRAYGASTAWVEGTDFEVISGLGQLALIPSAGRTWPVAWRAVKVVLTAGYEAAPPSLVPLVAATVQSLLDRPNLQQQANAGMGGTTVSTTDLEHLIPAAVRAALDEGFLVCRRR